jgi:hypothetical protein
MASELFKVIATFVDKQGNPLSGPEFSARLMDRDCLFDDRLGASPLADDGSAEFTFSTAEILSVDSPDERTPDLYFVLCRDGDTVFMSDIYKDVDFDRRDEVTGRQDQLTQKFGPFQVALP